MMMMMMMMMSVQSIDSSRDVRRVCC